MFSLIASISSLEIGTKGFHLLGAKGTTYRR
jgi:hypothetical protein